MVRFTTDQKVYIKILYWGMGGSGKTTIVDTLYRLTKEDDKDIKPTGELTKISMESGSTLYFDRGIFQSTKQRKVFYHVYTVAGQSRFSPLRKKIFKGTDGVIFTIDSQTHFFEDNIESLKELKNVTRGKLIKEIPLIVMLNKQDLTEVIGEEDVKQVLKDEKLWYEPNNELYIWNPILYKTCALWDKKRNIYRSFNECARRTVLYQIYGDGSAPIGIDYSQFSEDLQKI
ncbi:MAG: Small GTP-binding domain protein [Promethearchaeota archaeon]|nr:MAG: Small GTP-binding domain protein [Candidatus Lokiarchaeota archaeon]